MFKHFLKWELNYRFRLLSTWVYFALTFFTSFLGIMAAGGFFSGVEVNAGDSTGKVYLNSPFILFNFSTLWSYLGMLIVTAVMMNAALRDFQNGSFQLFFTKPIRKWDYLGGRFVGSFISIIFIFSGIGIGILLATSLPILDRDLIGPFKLLYFLNPYFVMIIPNLFIMSTLFFSISIITRKAMPVYSAAVVFLVGYMIALGMMDSIESREIASLFEPFGFTASMFDTIQYWTIAQKNTSTIPLVGIFLWNRIMWITLSIFLLLATLWRFKFTQFLRDKSSGTSERSYESQEPVVSARSAIPVAGSTLQHPEQTYSISANLYVFTRMLKHEASAIIKSVPFLVIVLAGVMFLSVNTRFIGYIYGTPGYPVTYKVLQNLSGQFMIFILIIATFYAGELIWRTRDLKSDQMLDALPVPGWVMYLSRLGALAAVLLLLMPVILLTGLTIQTVRGFYRYEIGLYLKQLLLFTYPTCFLMGALAIAVQSVVSNKYFGHFLMIIYYITDDFMYDFGFQHILYSFNRDLGYPYSDMNGFGHYTTPYIIIKSYWFIISALLLIIGYLFWPRGTELRLKARWKAARTRWTRGLQAATLTLVGCAAAFAGFIYYNTNVLNQYYTSHEMDTLLEQYERLYKQYERDPQPKITDVSVHVELYPDKRTMETAGVYTLVNKSGELLKTVYLTIPDNEVIVDELTLDRDFVREIDDREHGFYSLKPERPINPDETVKLNFKVAFRPKGFPNARINSDFVANGTFFNNKEYFPTIGYMRDLELSGDVTRKRRKLPPRERMASLDDSEEINNNYVSQDADWINYEAVIGTSSDQTALTCGHLLREWDEDGRSYSHYRMDRPMIHFYPVISARYKVKRERMNDLDLAVYYHPGHEWNIGRMMDSLKKSTDYYSKSLSPFQFDQLKIIEFPRYNSFAQSFANTIPYSESIGFMAQITGDDVDYPFGITAHETAHQWWAHQVIGANVQGVTMLSEMLAQYGELMMAINEFSPKTTRKYLRYELDQYLQGRGSEADGELPMITNENQGYIHYSKSSVIMNQLQDYLGADQVNEALAKFIRDFGYSGPPYPRSVDLLPYLEEICPEDYRYLISDLFEKVILYDNKVIDAQATLISEGEYSVTISAETNKTRVEGLGDEFEEPLNDWIEFGILDAEGEPLQLERIKVGEKMRTVTMKVSGKPHSAGIDPLRKLIDKRPSDNVKRVKIIQS